MGLCYAEPLVEIVKPGRPSIFYGNLTPELMSEIVRDYLVGDDPRPDLAMGTRGDGIIDGIPRLSDLPVLRRQVRIALRNCGNIDPTDIGQYVAAGGYGGLKKALLEMTPQGVIDEITRAGLRGRGGAGFPTARKWQFCRDAPGSVKYAVCNADEGDPGAFMDRSILEGRPHSVLEGLAIAGYAIGAAVGYVYVRTEYPLAVKRLRTAVSQAEERGLLGTDIFGTGFGFSVRVMEGAGAFVCGEETALLASIESRRGTPRPRPPFPAQSGLDGKPTIINNVKTLSMVPPIIERGADWFAGIGTEKSKGTAVFALTGKIANSGLVEVPMGTPLSTIIYEIGGGIPRGKRLKAVQTGGPSGGCIPARFVDLPVDYESLAKSARSWAPAAWSSWTRPPAWSTWPAISSASPSPSRAASVRPAAWGPGRCCRFSPESPRARAATRISTPPVRRPDGQGVLPLRTGPDLAQPGSLHDQLLPRRVRGPYQREKLPGGGLRRLDDLALPAHLPCGDQHPPVCRPDRRG